MCVGDDSDLLPQVKAAKRVTIAALVFAILAIVGWVVIAVYAGPVTGLIVAYLYVPARRSGVRARPSP